MFTENLVLTTIQQNYFSNANFLAKEIKKILQLISKRELSLQSNIHEIKHSRLLFLIETVFHKDVLIEEITIHHIDDLKVRLTDYLKQFITNKYLIEELFKTLYMKSFCEDVINTKNKYLNRIKTCIKQINKIIDKNDLDDLSMEVAELDIYMSIIRKQYAYVWYPTFYREKFFTGKDNELLNKYKLNVIYDKLFILLEQLIISYHLIRLYYEDGKDTYFLQKNAHNNYAEDYYMKSEISKYFHCGLDMSDGVDTFNSMMKEHMSTKFGSCIYKVSWKNNDFNFIHIEYQDKLYVLEVNFKHLSFAMVEDNLKITLIDYLVFYDSLKCSYRLRGKTGNIGALKNFFIFGQDNDYIEYHLEDSTRFNEILNVKLKINEITFETQYKKISLSYEELFSLESEIYTL